MLTEKQRKAVEAHAIGIGKTKACKIAGYQDETESARLFKNPEVIRELEKVRAMASRKLSLEVKDVLEGLMDGVSAAQNTMELVAAWREIGKIIGAYEHAKHIEVKVKHEDIRSVKQLELMDDADLAALADMGDDFIIEGEVIEDVVQHDDAPATGEVSGAQHNAGSVE